MTQKTLNFKRTISLLLRISARSKMLTALFTVLFTVLLIMIGCAELTQGNEIEGQGKIVNGQDDSGHPYVVSLVNQQGASICTGTLIGPKTVLTAAHCILSDGRLNPPAFIEIGSYIGASNNPRIPISSYLMREGWDGQTSYNNDIALLYLSTTAPVPAIPYSSSNPATLLNQAFLAIGYGNNNGFQNSGSGIKRSVSLTLVDVMASYFIGSWLEGEPLSTCQGDSGGPALIQGYQGMEVLGVVSNGPIFCQGNIQYTSVYAHRDWITQHLDGTGATNQTPATPPEDFRYITCQDVEACINTCQSQTTSQEAFQNCAIQECQGRGAPTGIAHYVAFKTCERDFNCTNNACLNTYCAEEMRLCGRTVGSEEESVGDPITSCVDLRSCDSDCYQMYPDVDQPSYRECSMRCYLRVSDTEVISQQSQLQSCLGQSGCNGNNDCQAERCREEILACGYTLSNDSPSPPDNPPPDNPPPTPTPSEGSTCTELYSCIAVCTQGDDGCFQRCESQSSQEGIDLLNALISCFQYSSCDNFFAYECIGAQCPEEFGACLEDL